MLMVTEIKIDRTYSNKRFAWDSNDIHREDQRKGGGGILMYVVKGLCSKRLKPPKKYTTLEVLAVQTKIDGENMLMIGIYRPPKTSGKNYYGQLENELNELLTWASMQCGNIIIGGDLNLDRSFFISFHLGRVALQQSCFSRGPPLKTFTIQSKNEIHN